MAKYSAGTLEFKIIGTSDASTVSLQNVVNKLNLMDFTLSTLMKRFNSFKTTVAGFSKQDLNWISSLSSRLTRLSNKDISGATANFLTLTNAITPFIDKVQSAQVALVALSKVMGKTNKMPVLDTSSINGTIEATHSDISQSKIRTGTLRKALNLGWALGKIYFIFNYTKRFAQMVTNMVQKAVDYTETLNMWQVAMRNNIDMADEFISKMNRAYGISEQNLMKYQATFKNMLSALGQINEEISYGLSEAITQMAIDYSSLYNVKMEQAMTTFRAMMAGQVRPIRSISGYDITENTIFQLYQDIGGTKTMRQLSQTEKRLLRILATYRQMGASGAVGDMSKTIEQMANQLRIMNELGTELSQWIGMLLKGLIESSKVLVYINAGLIVARRIVQSMAVFFGYETPDFLTDLVTTVEEGNEALDEMTGKLLSFDKFEALNKSGAGDVQGAIDEKLLTAISQYQSILGDTSFEAQGIADSWLKTLGFQYNATTQLWEYEDGMETIVEKIKQAGTGMLGWGALFLGIKHPVGLLVASIAYLYATSEDFRTSINGISDVLGELKIGQRLFDDIVLLTESITYIINLIAKGLNWVLSLTVGDNRGTAPAAGSPPSSPSAQTTETLKDILGQVMTIGLTSLAGYFMWGSTGGTIVLIVGLGLELLKDIQWLQSGGKGNQGIFGNLATLIEQFLEKHGFMDKFMEGLVSHLHNHPILEWLITAMFDKETKQKYKDYIEDLGVGMNFSETLYDAIMTKFLSVLYKMPFLAWIVDKMLKLSGNDEMRKKIEETGFSFDFADNLFESIRNAFILAVQKTPFIGWIFKTLFPDAEKGDFSYVFNKGKEIGSSVMGGIQSEIYTVTVPIEGVVSGGGFVGSKLSRYASGGFIEDGIFTMNKGELAGNFFDGTPVAANNMQIIQGIKSGVFEGVSKAMQNSNKGGGDVYIDGTKVGKVTERHVYAEGTRVGHFGR